MYGQVTRCHALLESATGKLLDDEEALTLSSLLAQEMMRQASTLATSKERRRLARIHQMIQHPKDKVFALNFTDRFFRPVDASRSFALLKDLSRSQAPSFLSKGEKRLFHFFLRLGKILPTLAKHLIGIAMRFQMNQIVAQDSKKAISSLIRKLQAEGLHANINRLGEAILGEQEACRRLNSYIQDFENPKIEMISVKISSLYSQINPIAFDETIITLQQRFKALLRAAMQKNAWVMLDMEEWKDLEMTCKLLTTTLDDPEFSHAQAGIALQAYIPESSTILEELIVWAKKRVDSGGSKIRIRLVKGANLAMERLEASLKSWPQAPYKKKDETDAHFIYMLHRLLEEDARQVCLFGIGSHNVFDLCYAGILASSKKCLSALSFETLAGMAPSLSLALAKVFPQSLLYCPVVAHDEFHTALAYLTRRLDENTAPENFLASLTQLTTDSASWQLQMERFERSVRSRNSVDRLPRRCQDRSLPSPIIPNTPFSNTPDSDWSISCNRQWGVNILKSWEEKPTRKIPLQIGGEYSNGITSLSREDPSRPTYIIHESQLAGPNHIEKAVQTARGITKDRINIDLFSIADALEKNRDRLIGAMVQEVAKSISEADMEVSEAIDFCRYYANQLISDASLFEPDTGEGVALVASPWNFPCSIPFNGIIAALALHKAVLFKPAPEAIGVGFELASILWEAGVPLDVLQFIPTRDDPEGYLLLQDKRIDTVFLTGSTDTGRLFIKSCPTRKLFAETGGKNAIIVSQAADLDVAVKEIIQSAFSFSGQKCSACSLVIVEKAILNHTQFLEKLKDAASSLPTGSAWDVQSKITPLSKEPTDAFMRAFSSLEPDEEWLLKPIQDVKNPLLFSPGIKTCVQPGSFTHTTELFGPILGIIEAKSIPDAISIANYPQYGLTAGLISLDPKEQALFSKEIRSGNRYINRAITGAIVGRQPFGGMKASSFGTGMKAGGPSFLLQLLDGTAEDKEQCSISSHSQLNLTSILQPIEENKQLVDVGRAYAAAYQTYFAKQRALQTCIGQDNFIFYEPHDALYLYISPDDQFQDVWKVASIAALLEIELNVYGQNLDISNFCRLTNLKNFIQSQNCKWYDEKLEFIRAFSTQPFPRFRSFQNPPEEFLKQISTHAMSIDVRPPSNNGRIELIHFLREISLSVDYHRFGNLQDREGEKRTEPK